MTRQFPPALLAALTLGAALASISGAVRAADEPLQEQPTCSDGLLKDVGKQLRVPKFVMESNDGGAIIAADCKASPDEPALTLTVIAYAGKKKDEKNLFIGLVDEKRHQIASSLSTVVEEDATMQLRANVLHLDTARYKLAPGVRAFGLDIDSSDRGLYCFYGGTGPTRFLYVREGKAIRQIMPGLILSRWHYLGEDQSQCGQLDVPERPVALSRRSLSMAPGRTNGYADLLVTVVSTVDGKRVKAPPATFLLRYDGKIYPTDALVGLE